MVASGLLAILIAAPIVYYFVRLDSGGWLFVPMILAGGWLWHITDWEKKWKEEQGRQICAMTEAVYQDIQRRRLAPGELDRRYAEIHALVDAAYGPKPLTFQSWLMGESLAVCSLIVIVPLAAMLLPVAVVWLIAAAINFGALGVLLLGACFIPTLFDARTWQGLRIGRRGRPDPPGPAVLDITGFEAMEETPR